MSCNVTIRNVMSYSVNVQTIAILIYLCLFIRVPILFMCVPTHFSFLGSICILFILLKLEDNVPSNEDILKTFSVFSYIQEETEAWT